MNQSINGKHCVLIVLSSGEYWVSQYNTFNELWAYIGLQFYIFGSVGFLIFDLI